MQVLQIECAESARLVSNSMSCGMQVWGAGRGGGRRGGGEEARGRGAAHRPVLSQVAAALVGAFDCRRYSAR